jgi:M61 glycyl aminopeptidase
MLFFALTAMPGLAEGDAQQSFAQGDRTLTLEISPDFSARQRENVSQWIEFLSGALLQVYGQWPRQQWRISVSPASASNSDPIPWAQVHRGDIDTVEFFTAPQATTQQLKDNWTGYHELAHLLIPYRGWGDNWFSEGLASFYQNILQARSGILSEQQAWQNIYNGFLLGRADSGFDGQTLASVSNAMRDDGGFMRVYWSGAWYFLVADIRLRQQSGGKLTLDLALMNLNTCCADAQLSVPQMVSKLDELNSVLLFQPLYKQVNDSTRMPPFENIFASLGISLANGKVTLQQQGPGAALRQQILQPRTL